MPDVPIRTVAAEFTAPTCATRYLPASALVVTYVALPAPLMEVHPEGIVVQLAATGDVHRNHACTNVGAGSPVQLPRSSVHVAPTAADPLTVGAIVLTGGVGPGSGVVLIAPDNDELYGPTAATWAVTYFPASAVVVR